MTELVIHTGNSKPTLKAIFPQGCNLRPKEVKDLILQGEDIIEIVVPLLKYRDYTEVMQRVNQSFLGFVEVRIWLADEQYIFRHLHNAGMLTSKKMEEVLNWDSNQFEGEGLDVHTLKDCTAGLNFNLTQPCDYFLDEGNIVKTLLSLEEKVGLFKKFCLLPEYYSTQEAAQESLNLLGINESQEPLNSLIENDIIYQYPLQPDWDPPNWYIEEMTEEEYDEYFSPSIVWKVNWERVIRLFS
jgi:hypothetical protein